MNRLSPLASVVVVSAILLAGLASVSCGGGGGNSTTPPGITASFAAANSAPGMNTVSMQPGPVSGSTFQVQIHITDITDFFGGAFRVPFDSSSLTFIEFNSSASFLEGMGRLTDIRAEIDQMDPNMLVVVATFQDQLQGFTVVSSRLLLTLTFNASSAGSSNFDFDIAATRQVQTCPAPPAACSAIPDGTLTWSGGTVTAN